MIGEPIQKYTLNSLHENPNSLTHVEANHAYIISKLCLHYGDFVQANFNMADKTAGQLESILHINKASAKIFEPRTIVF